MFLGLLFLIVFKCLYIARCVAFYGSCKALWTALLWKCALQINFSFHPFAFCFLLALYSALSERLLHLALQPVASTQADIIMGPTGICCIGKFLTACDYYFYFLRFLNPLSNQKQPPAAAQRETSIIYRASPLGWAVGKKLWMNAFGVAETGEQRSS